MARVFDITITGKGAHGAHPQQSIDPVLVACHLGTALQSIVSRNISARDTAVLSITRINPATLTTSFRKPRRWPERSAP